MGWVSGLSDAQRLGSGARLRGKNGKVRRSLGFARVRSLARKEAFLFLVMNEVTEVVPPSRRRRTLGCSRNGHQEYDPIDCPEEG
jgi:hypothetical protein